MPLFYFDTDDGDGITRDAEGLDLVGIEEARSQAQIALVDMARDLVPGTGIQRTMLVRVRNGSGKTVLKASLVLRVDLQP